MQLDIDQTYYNVFFFCAGSYKTKGKCRGSLQQRRLVRKCPLADSLQSIIKTVNEVKGDMSAGVHVPCGIPRFSVLQLPTLCHLNIFYCFFSCFKEEECMLIAWCVF